MAEVAKDISRRKGSGSAAELYEFIKKVGGGGGRRGVEPPLPMSIDAPVGGERWTRAGQGKAALGQGR